MCVSYVPRTLRMGMNCVLPVVRNLVPTACLTLTLPLTEGWARQPPSVEAIPLVRVPVLHSWMATAPITRT